MIVGGQWKSCHRVLVVIKKFSVDNTTPIHNTGFSDNEKYEKELQFDRLESGLLSKVI